MFTAVNTSALCLANMALLPQLFPHSDKFIQERDHLNALFVADDLYWLQALHVTVEFTVERNRTNVMYARKHLVGLQVFTLT